MGVYEALGVQKVINAAGDLTSLGGTLMLPKVRAAMDEASRFNATSSGITRPSGDAGSRTMTAREVRHRLREGDPPIYLADWLVSQETLGVYPCNLEPGQADLLVDRLRTVLVTAWQRTG